MAQGQALQIVELAPLGPGRELLFHGRVLALAQLAVPAGDLALGPDAAMHHVGHHAVQRAADDRAVGRYLPGTGLDEPPVTQVAGIDAVIQGPPAGVGAIAPSRVVTMDGGQPLVPLHVAQGGIRAENAQQPGHSAGQRRIAGHQNTTPVVLIP